MEVLAAPNPVLSPKSTLDITHDSKHEIECHFENIEYNPETFRSLRRAMETSWRQLRRLIIGGNVSDSYIKYLLEGDIPFPKLEELSMCPREPEDLTTFIQAAKGGRLPALKSITVNICPEENDEEALEVLSLLWSNVTSLTIWPGISPVDFSILEALKIISGNFPSLEHLRLGFTVNRNTIDAFEELAIPTLKFLKLLSYPDVRFIPRFFAEIAPRYFPNLEKLVLGSSSFIRTEDGFLNHNQCFL